MEENVDSICEKLNTTELEEEEIRVGPKVFREVVERDNKYLLMKLISAAILVNFEESLEAS